MKSNLSTTGCGTADAKPVCTAEILGLAVLLAAKLSWRLPKHSFHGLPFNFSTLQKWKAQVHETAESITSLVCCKLGTRPVAQRNLHHHFLACVDMDLSWTTYCQCSDMDAGLDAGAIHAVYPRHAPGWG